MRANLEWYSVDEFLPTIPMAKETGNRFLVTDGEGIYVALFSKYVDQRYCYVEEGFVGFGEIESEDISGTSDIMFIGYDNIKAWAMLPNIPDLNNL